MENKHECKKWHRELPKNYEKDVCVACQNKFIEKAKKIGLGAVGGAGTLVVAGKFVVKLTKNILN